MESKKKSTTASNKGSNLSTDIYKTLIDNSSLAIFLSRPTGEIIEVNNAAEKMFGYSKADFVKIGRLGILDHTDINLPILLAQRREAGKTNGEIIGIKKNDERFPIAFTSSIFKDHSGEELTCSIMQDITDRKIVEQEMELMLNNTEECFMLLDKDLLILNFNKQFKYLYKKYFHSSVEKGLAILNFVKPERTTDAEEIYKSVLSGEVIFKTLEAKDEEGSSHYFKVKFAPSKNEGQEIIGFFITIREITEETKSTIEIEKRQKKIEQAEVNYRELFEKGIDGIFIHEHQSGRVVDANQKACKIFGLDREELLKLDLSVFAESSSDFTPENLPDKLIKASNGTPQLFEGLTRHSNGTLNFVEVSLQRATIAGKERILAYFRLINDRKNAERQSQLLKQDNEVLINTTDELIWSFDCELKLIAANNAYFAMTATITTIPHKIGDVVLIDEYGEALNATWKVYYQRALGGEKYTLEEQFCHPITQRLTYELVSFNPIFSSNKKITGVACYSRDITELTETQLAVKATKAELDNVMASSMDMICTVAEDNRIVRVSAASETILGYKPEELIGKFIFDFVYHEDMEETQNHVQQVITSKSKVNYYNRYVRKDGTLVYLEWTAQWDAHSKNRYGVARDVTAKVETENKLKLSEQRFKSLVQDGGDMIAIIDAQANYIYISPTSFNILGYFPEEFQEKNAFDFIHPEDVETVQSQFGLLEHTKKITLQPFRFKHKNGEWRWIETSVTNLMDEPSIQGMVANSRDVTERKNIEEALLTTKEDYKNLFENSPAPMFIFDFKTLQIIDCNKETLLKYGYSKEEFLQLTIKDIRPKEDIAKINEAVEIEETYGEIHKKIWRHKKKNGEIMYMDITGHLINYDDRRVSLVMLIDITEKLKIEQQNEFEKRDKEALINNTKDLIWSVSNDYKLIAANKAFINNLQDFWGISVKAGDNIILEEFFPTGILDFWKDCYERTFAGEVFKKEVHNTALRNRTEAWFEINFNPIFKGNEVTGVACNARDITDSKKAAEIIKHSNVRYEYVTKATYDAIWEWDILNNTIYRAEGFERSFGFNLNELNKSETKWENFIQAEDRQKANESIQAAIKSDKDYWSHEYRLVKPNGENAYVEDRAYILRDPAGGAQRIIGALRDITEKKYYHELEILDKDVLEKNAQGEKNIKEVIGKYISGIQKLHPGMICSMQTLKNNRLYNLASPDLPKDYLAAIYGVEIGNNVGSCGTAAFLKEKIIVTDIATDIRWANYKELAANVGLKACWSYPIFDSKNNVVATFAIYYTTIKTPTAQEENIIKRAGNILQTILESQSREAALQESNQRYLNVTKATFDAIWDWDIAANNVYWGEIYRELFGEMEDEHLNDAEKVHARLHPEEMENVLASAGAALEGRNLNWALEHRYLKKDLSYAYVLNKALIVRDTNGKAVRVFGAMQDITHQKKEEQRLKLMSSVVTGTNDSVLITEAEPLNEPGPRIIFANEAFTKMTGYTEAEIIGKTPLIFQGPKTDLIELERLKNCLKKGESCEVTVVNYKKNGDEFWNNFTASPVSHDKGGHTHFIYVEKDITDRKNEELLKELLRKIRIIFNEPIGIKTTLDMVLKEVAIFGNFCFAESWLLSADKKEIKRATNYAPDPTMRIILTEKSILNEHKKGEGLVGTAWQTLALQIWEDKKELNNIIEQDVLQTAGITKIYALPFLNNAEIIGVLVFGLNSPETSTLKFENLFSSLKIYLGAEIKRKQLEQELNQIFNFAPDIIAILGTDGYFKKINPAACDLLEYSLDELMAVPFLTFVHPEDENKTTTEFKDLFANKAALYFENRCITKSGKVKWFAWTSILSREDEVLLTVGKDITEKKDLEVVLNKTNNLARIGSWELDLEKNTLFWSEMTKQIHETSSDFKPSLETAMNSYKEGKNRDQMIRRVEEAIEKGIAWDVELQIITEKGHERWIRSIGETEFKNGICTKVYGSLQDINERKRAEENIRSSEERRELIMKAALDAIICIDENGNVTFWNPQAVLIFGWKESEVMGRRLSGIIIPEKYKDRHERGMENYFKTGKGKALNKLLQLSAIKKSGVEFPIELTVLPIEQDGDEFFCAFIRDITERKLSETRLLNLNHSLQTQTYQLAAINKELEQFAYVASHDLQEPLRMITSFLSQIELKYENVLDEKGKKYIYFAVDGAKRMRQIILDLLEYSTIGRIDELKENIDLNTIVDEIKILYTSKIEEQQAIIITDQLPVIVSYKSPVRQVFQNIIGNSLKYCKKGRPCLIKIFALDMVTQWQFSVQDNGIGINKEYFDKIFVIFQRLHTKETYSGTGLGLAVTKKIIENLNGKIWLESVENEGTIFHFTIPKI